MFDIDLLTILNDPAKYKDKVSELKRIMVDLDKAKLEDEKNKTELVQLRDDALLAQRTSQRNIDTYRHLQQDFEEEKRKLSARQAELNELNKSIGEHEDSILRRETELEKRKIELQGMESKLNQKEIEANKIYTEALSIKDQYERKVNKLMAAVRES
jgi:chromosome segregation ATPase